MKNTFMSNSQDNPQDNSQTNSNNNLQNNNLTINRCAWCSNDPLYINYHDHEWGVPLFDEQKLFELLVLESFQAGLSWLTVLKKREAFRVAFANFNALKIAKFSDEYLEQLLLNPAIIRNRHKVCAVRANAQAWLKLDNPVTFLWDIVDGTPIVNHFKNINEVPAQTALAQTLSNKLKQAGFVRFGGVTCYAFMQAVGMVMDHTVDCFRYKELCQ